MTIPELRLVRSGMGAGSGLSDGVGPFRPCGRKKILNRPRRGSAAADSWIGTTRSSETREPPPVVVSTKICVLLIFFPLA